MPGRTIAIGDIHGCYAALGAVLEAVDPQPDDTLIPLGDYVDRGMQSREVLDRLIELGAECRMVPILGNHDELMLDVRQGGEGLLDWLSFGGTTTLFSFGATRPQEIPEKYIDFLYGCVPYHEDDRHFFLHATYYADMPLAAQPGDVLRWASLRDRLPGPHYSGKKAVVGHTSQKDGSILDLGYLVCIDTCCYGGGWLTAMDVATGQVWQADREGRPKSGPPAIKQG